ncbi:MAG: hypothetical protein AAFX06_31205 [Planctomycetota bacterium]
MFSGQIGTLVAIDAPGGDLMAGASCAGAMALLPLLVAIVLWKRPRLLFFLSLYSFGLAAAMTCFLALYAAPHVIPGLAKALSPENQQWIESTGIRWFPPSALIILAVFAGIGLWFGDRQETKNTDPRH